MEIYQSLGYLLNVSARLIKRKLDVTLKEYDITTSQWAVLKLLAAEDNLSQAEIANKLNSDRATGGAVIDKLIGKELLKKELFENDRRSYRVSITPSALEVANEISSLAENVNNSAVTGLSDDEIIVLNKCLKKIINNLGEDKDVIGS